MTVIEGCWEMRTVRGVGVEAQGVEDGPLRDRDRGESGDDNVLIIVDEDCKWGGG